VITPTTSKITWVSDKPGVISADGKTVTRPLFGAGNVTTTLTATIKKGLVTDTKAFTLTVLELPNQAPTLAEISNQTICYTTTIQTIALTGITAGPETGQTTTLSVSTDKPGMFAQLSIAGGVLTYKFSSGASGIATITVTVKDNGGTADGGVDSFSRTFTLTENALPVAAINSSKGSSISKGETAVLTVSGGTSYKWATANGIISGQNTAILTVRPSVSTTYIVTVSNASGCSIVQSISINVTDDYKALDGANVLSPNGDGKNDKWVIKNIDMYPDNTVRIFDRAGKLVYFKQGYTNDWDGTIKGAPLAQDTYYYVVDLGSGAKLIKGFISIVR